MSRRARWEVPQGRSTRATDGAARGEKERILDEFCETTGYQRKYALRLLNGPVPGPGGPGAGDGRRRTGCRVIQALAAIWGAAGYPWSVG